MISDRVLSIHGYRMWQRLFEDCVILNKTHKMNVININDGNILKNIKNEDEMDEFFGSNMLEIRFVLEKL